MSEPPIVPSGEGSPTGSPSPAPPPDPRYPPYTQYPPYAALSSVSPTGVSTPGILAARLPDAGISTTEKKTIRGRCTASSPPSSWWG